MKASKLHTKAAIAAVTKKHGSKFVSRMVSKSAGKLVARTAGSPYLIASDIAEVGTTTIGKKAGWSDSTTNAASKGAAYLTAGGVGFAIGNVPGAITAVGIQATSDLIERSGVAEDVSELLWRVARPYSTRKVRRLVSDSIQGSSFVWRKLRHQLPW